MKFEDKVGLVILFFAASSLVTCALVGAQFMVSSFTPKVPDGTVYLVGINAQGKQELKELGKAHGRETIEGSVTRWEGPDGSQWSTRAVVLIVRPK